jgi:hypothetical protein
MNHALQEETRLVGGARTTIVERALPAGLGSAVEAFERLIATPIETGDGTAVVACTHRLRPRGFGVETTATVQLAGTPDSLTIDIALAEATDGNSVVRLATRGHRHTGFDTAHAVLDDITRAIETLCRVDAVALPP